MASAPKTRTLTTALRSEVLASVYSEVAKAHATRKLARQAKWRGCLISVENDKGSTRRGVDRDGHTWENVIKTPYGYFKGTQTPNGGSSGGDGEHLDVLLVEHDVWEDCPVFVIHQRKAGTVADYDEDKVILGCLHESEAKQAYLDNYDAHGKDLIGAISMLAPETLEAHIKGGRENWGRPLVHGARQKIMIRSRQIEKAQRLLEERREWMRGVVAVEKAGGPVDQPPFGGYDPECDEVPALDIHFYGIPGLPTRRTTPIYFTDDDGEVVDVDPCESGRSREELLEERRAVSKSLSPVVQASQAVAQGAFEVIADIEKAVNGGGERRLLRVTPSFEAIDLQNQLTTKDVIREAWPYYELAGNFDLEHLTKKGNNKTFAEYCELIRAQGFKIPDDIDEVAGRDYYELGRPVKGSFDPESCTYVVEIYQGHPVADWFWSTLTEVSPPWPWKCSVGGAAKLTEVVAHNPDPIFGKDRAQKFEVLRQFRMNNCAATLEPVVHYCPPVEVIRAGDTAISKGLDVELTEETPMSNPGMQKASDVIKSTLLGQAQAMLSDMHDSGQLESGEVLTLTADIAKALEAIEHEAEVTKALEYGTVTTDIGAMTGAQAFTGESLSMRQVRRMARDLLDDTQDGFTPFQKGFQWGDDPDLDVAEFVATDMNLTWDDALLVSKAFFDLVGQSE